MKIKQWIYVLILVGVLLAPFSCSDNFLNQTNTQAASQDVLFKKSDDGVAIVTSIYDTFHNTDFMIKAIWYQANFLSQDFKNYGADTFFETYEVPSGFAALETMWTRSYTGISRANSAIPILAQMKEKGYMTAELADRLTGEAYFLRGVFYYYLASNFGGVPIELSSVTTGLAPKSTQDEVFTQVASDMTTAASLLPWPQDLAAADVGRATKGAALAYLGDAQMWLGKYADAVTTYNQLDSKYTLEHNFLDIHRFLNQNGKESIFEIQFIESANMSWGANNNNQWVSTFSMPWEITQFGYSYADKKLHDSFEVGDARRIATVIGPDDVHPDTACQIKKYPQVVSGFASTDPVKKARYTGPDGNIINTCGSLINFFDNTKDNIWMGDDHLRSGYYGVKNWRDPKGIGNSGAVAYIFSSQNEVMMRYGQVLLSKAEALFKSGNSAAALDIVNNQIRNRAGLGAAAGTDVMEIILEEYRHELAGEFSLWFVLRRSGEHIKFVKERYGIDVPNGKDLMPIPQAEVSLNPNLKQNPGY